MKKLANMTERRNKESNQIAEKIKNIKQQIENREEQIKEQHAQLVLDRENSTINAIFAIDDRIAAKQSTIRNIKRNLIKRKPIYTQSNLDKLVEEIRDLEKQRNEFQDSILKRR